MMVELQNPMPNELVRQRTAAAALRLPQASRVPLVTLKDLLWFVYLYLLRPLAALLPRAWLYRLGRLAEPFALYRSRRRIATVVRRMLAAGCAPETAAEIARRFVSNAVFRILDDLVVNRRSFRQAPRYTVIEGIEHLRLAQSAGRGVLLLSVHTYASRIAKRHLASLGVPILTVRDKRPSDVLAGRFGRRFLQPRYMEFLHTLIQDEVFIQDPECALKILKRLRSGGLVNIHFDAPAGMKTVEWPFLGAPRAFAAGLFDMIRLSGCMAVPMLCLGRMPDLRIFFGPPARILEAPSAEEFVRLNLPPFAQIFEKQILDNPADWELWTRL